MGDLASQVASLHVGERELRRLIARYGSGIIAAAVDELIRYSETRMRARITEVPDGTYRWEDVLDDDGVSAGPIAIRAAITISGSDVVVDFTGTDPQVRGPINCMIGMTLGSVYYVLVAALDPHIPKNYGCYAPIRVIAPEGTIVHPRPPAPVAGRMETGHRIVDVLLGCLAQAVPDKVMAPFYGSTNHIILSGEDPQSGKTWVALEIQPGGWGGRPGLDGNDGWSAHMHNVQNVPIEIEETTYPLRVERYELLPGTGGAGRWRGGLGLRRELRLLTEAGHLTLHCDRVRFPAPACWGRPGRAGAVSRQPRHAVCARDRLQGDQRVARDGRSRALRLPGRRRLRHAVGARSRRRSARRGGAEDHDPGRGVSGTPAPSPARAASGTPGTAGGGAQWRFSKRATWRCGSRSVRTVSRS